MSTYYYCPVHQRGIDPQELHMQAAAYGWTEVECPFHDTERTMDHKPAHVPFWEMLGVVTIYFGAAALIQWAYHWPALPSHKSKHE